MALPENGKRISAQRGLPNWIRRATKGPLLDHERADHLSLGAPPVVDDSKGDRAPRLGLIDPLYPKRRSGTVSLSALFPPTALPAVAAHP